MAVAIDRRSPPDLLTMSEAAALAGVHRNTIRTWCATGRVGFVRINRRGEHRLRRADLERVIAARQARATLEARGRSGAPEPTAGHDHATDDGAEPARATRGDVLRRIAAEISSRVDLETLFDDVIDDAVALFGVDLAGLWLYDGRDGSVSIAAQRGLSSAILEHVAQLRVGDRSPGLSAIHERRVVVIGPSLEGTADALRAAYRRSRVRSVCFVPIVFRDEPLGVLVLYHRRPYDWSPDEIGVARSFTDALATAIANARLYDSVRSLAASLDAIQELGLRLNRIQGTTEIGEAIIEEARALIEFDTIRVYRVDHAAGWCEPIAFRGQFRETGRPTAEVLRVPVGTGLTGWVAAHNETVMVGDAERDPRGLLMGALEGPESMLVVPMSYEDAVQGVIVLSRPGADRFTRDDERTLSIFATSAAQALRNADWLEQVRRQQAELEQQLATQRRLLEVNEHLLATLDPQGVLEMIADSLKSVVAYDSLSIYRIDRERQVRRAVVARDRFADLILQHESPVDAGINGWVFQNGEAVLCNDAHVDPRSVQVPGTPFEPESMIVVPLTVEGAVVGTLSLGRMGEAESHFSDQEFELTKLFASQASIALQNAEAHGAVKVRADHDSLTGLRNHGAFQRELGAAIGNAARRPLALLMLDLDAFKAFNDARGHPAGDRLLQEVAVAIRGAVRDGDAIYRYGGDEFAVVLPGAGRRAGTDVADRIRAAVAALSDTTGGPRVTISVGVACLPDDAATKDELVDAADRALYDAKPSSRLRGDPAARDPYLAALDETALALRERLQPEVVLETIMARATALLGTPHGYIYLADETEGALVVRVGVGLFARFVGDRMAFGTGLGGQVYATGQPVVVDDYDGFENRLPDMPPGLLGAIVGIPLIAGNAVVGVLGLATGTPARPFGEREIAALKRFGQLASIALDNASLFEAVRRGALYDTVTGLPNRDQLSEQLTQALSTGPDRPIAVLLLDLDRFEVINESLGHSGGDRLLRAVGERLAACVRPGDTVARFGGDEFAILLDPVTDAGEARRVADRILAELEVPFELGGRDWFIAASLGIAVGRVGRSSDDLLRESEIALVHAKGDANHQHALFEPAMSSATLERVDLERDLRRALDRGELRLHYQPIVDLADDGIVGFEALVRWQHPTRGLVPPLSFIPLAEESGLIVPLGWWVLETACRQGRAWREAHPDRPPTVSVNLSARQFTQPDLVEQVSRILETTGASAEMLELEITESVLMDQSETGTRTLRALRALGVRLVLDDFGTGYSSLSYLKHLPLDTIKIDRQFIDGLDRSGPDLPIVQAVIALAHGLGIGVVGEGIETEDQAAILRELGCDRGQGFAYARPLAAPAAGAMLGDGAERASASA